MVVKGSYQCGFGEDSEGKGGNKKTVGEDGKKGDVMQDHPAGLANWADCLKQFLENKESLWGFCYGTSQHRDNPILGLHRELS